MPIHHETYLTCFFSTGMRSGLSLSHPSTHSHDICGRARGIRVNCVEKKVSLIPSSSLDDAVLLCELVDASPALATDPEDAAGSAVAVGRFALDGRKALALFATFFGASRMMIIR